MQLGNPLMYIGPNRRSGKTVIEWQLLLAAGEQAAFRSAAAGGLHEVQTRLGTFGGQMPEGFAAGLQAGVAPESSVTSDVARCAAAVAVALQRAAGHRVCFTAVLPGADAGQCRMIYEYEHLGTGLDAGELAMRLLSASIPCLQWEPATELPGNDLEDACRAFLARAAEYVLPLDTQAIIDAAARLDVPCVKLEREPYGRLEGDFRIRRNGLLKLGHACYQHVVDGTLCIDRNPELVPLLFDREKLFECLSRLELPAPRQDGEFRNLITAKRAVRAAQRLGYPVVLKPANRSRRDWSAARVFAPLGSAEEVSLAFAQTRQSSPRVIIERYVAGRTVHLLLANHEPLCLVLADGGMLPASATHASILDMAVRVSQTLGSGLLVITLVTSDPGRPLAENGGAVVDLDPAPQLDRLLPGAASVMDQAAEGFVRWLYPPEAPCRIPLVAVTGTNGKTTTSRMIARIMRTAGFRPGMASTSGVYFNEIRQHKGDLAGSEGHHILFESRDINLGVLETARGGLAHSGLMFDWCDVAVCVNVSEDHLGEYGIETLEQMTLLKRSVLERARRAVVLNADYPASRGMLPFTTGIPVYLVSLESDAAALQSSSPGPGFACVLEEEDGSEWIVLYEPGGTRLPVLPVSTVPATLGGTARFNISNAQHALCACHALGAGEDAIRRGLSTFEASFDNTPGRLNIYRQLPFTVVMDYAHNPDGMKKLCAFTDQVDVPGRKILLYAAYGNRADPAVAAHACSPIGHFDRFVCRDYPELRGRKPGEIPALMKSTLLDAGVGEERITLAADAEQAAFRTLSMAQPGDLVVMIPATSEVEKMWQVITSFQAENEH